MNNDITYQYDVQPNHSFQLDSIRQHRTETIAPLSPPHHAPSWRASHAPPCAARPRCTRQSHTFRRRSPCSPTNDWRRAEARSCCGARSTWNECLVARVVRALFSGRSSFVGVAVGTWELFVKRLIFDYKISTNVFRIKKKKKILFLNLI